MPALFRRHIIHTKQTVTTFPETYATNVTIGVGAHPAQEGGGDANKHPASGSLAVSVCFLFPFFADGQGPDAIPSIVANEAGARLALKEKNSVFSIDLSANAPKSLHATLAAKILSPDDKLLAEASVSVPSVLLRSGLRIKQTSGALQVIVLDHAAEIEWDDLPLVHLVEDWRDGRALIPPEW